MGGRLWTDIWAPCVPGRCGTLEMRNMMNRRKTGIIGGGASGLMGGIAFVVRNINISYEKSAVLDDLLTVETTVTETGRVSMTLEQLIKREDELIARLTVKLACIDIREKKLARIDDRLISQL